jgi:hypothetical protein
MTGKKQPGGRWCETTVVIQEDILAQAQAVGIDISRVCNHALADATGLPCNEKPGTATPPAPVIIAHNGAPSGDGNPPPASAPSAPLHPVINADAPNAAITARQAPRTPAPKPPAGLPGRINTDKPQKPPAALPAPVKPAPERAEPGTPAEAREPPAPASGKKPPAKKGKGRASPVRQFVTGCIVREDAEDALVSKEQMYQAFARWCREHRIAPVPDRKVLAVALKNQFALKETAAGSEPAWANVRLQ